MSDAPPVSFDDDDDEAMREAEREAQKSAQQARKRTARVQTAAATRELPHSAEAEEHVIACCLLDGSDTIIRAQEAGITPPYFIFPANRLLYEIVLKLHGAGKTVMLETVAEELKTSRQLDAIGGFAYLMQVTGKIPTTAHAGYFIEKVREKYLLRELIKRATGAVEQAYQFTGGLEEFLSKTRADLDEIGTSRFKRPPMRKVSEFKIPAKKDKSVLLGNRYLNRGDGMIISGSSGIGKSSVELQMVCEYALGRPFHGIQPNGELKSLITQSEDTDGDVAEVLESIKFVNKYSAEDLAKLDRNIRVVSDRITRGPAFIRELKRNIEEFTPDLVWINPLQAFFGGKITESDDIGAFLREGLNGLNKEEQFGYVIIHHTTKPATGKDRGERLWHEVMYDMAGGAELINWARAIMSLRASETEGEFKLVLAKRGRRAGVVKMVESGVGQRPEIVTTIGLKHSNGFLPGGTPVIYWEPCEVPSEPSEKGLRGGSRSSYSFNDYRNIFPPKSSQGLPLAQLHKLLITNKDIKKTTLYEALKRWEQEGDVEVISLTGQPIRYRSSLL